MTSIGDTATIVEMSAVAHKLTVEQPAELTRAEVFRRLDVKLKRGAQ
jgi:hypothetical protein